MPPVFDYMEYPLVISRTFAVLASFLFLSACGSSSGGDGTSPPPPPPPPANVAPTVDAGADATIRLPNDSVMLDGTVSDDGLPGNTVTTEWTMVTGPSNPVFDNAAAVDTTVTFSSEGTYVLQLTADDTELQSSDNVQITVEAAPAVAVIAVSPASVTLEPGQTQAFSASGTDQYGDPIATNVTWTQTGGSIDANGTYTAGAAAGAFTVTATDGSVVGTANVTIVIPGTPIADDQAVSTQEDTPLDILLTATDSEGDPLTYAIVSGPANGVLSETSGSLPATITYTPDPDFNGGDSFTFTANDGLLTSPAATVTITVNPVNDAPVVSVTAPADNSSFEEGETISFQANATDVEDDDATLTAAIEWNSDVDGAIGTGGTLDVSTLSEGSHVITASVTDSGAETGSDSVNISVVARAYWTFDEGSGTIAVDSIGDNDATIVGASFTTGINNTALDFDAVDDRVVVDDAADLDITGTEISLVAWINPRNGGKQNFSRIISKRTEAEADGGDVYAMMLNSYRLRFRLDGGTDLSGQDMDSSHIVQLDTWTHVAMVYNGTDMRIYINGELDGATPVVKSDVVDSSPRAVHIGRREKDNPDDGLPDGRDFGGFIDEVQIFGRALSAQEVVDLHASFTPPPVTGLFFTDITADAGVDTIANGGHAVAFAEISGPGGNDSLPDYYLTNNLEGFPDRADQFYVNVNGATFTEDAAVRGIADQDGGSHGAVWADFDNDGDYDLVNGSTWDNANPTSGFPASNSVFQNDGSGSFTENTDAVISAVAQETRGVAAFDWNGDGDLDLFSIAGENDPELKEAYQNDGNFAFSIHDGGDLTSATVPTTQGVTDTDYDGDGDIDILTANRGDDITFDAEFAILNNDGNGTFTRVLPSTLGILDIAKDSVTSADIDNDGDLDLLLTSSLPFNGQLYIREEPAGTYTKQDTFLTVDGFMGGFADLDNDGDQDLVFAGDERVYINQGDGSFVAGQSVPIEGILKPRSIAFADIDNDGDLDFAVSAEDSTSRLIRNDWDNTANNWLKVRLVAANGQAGAFGAKTFVYPSGQGGSHPNPAALIGMRESGSVQGYLSQDNPVLHFGLGPVVETVDIVVEFVDGTTATCTNVAANTPSTIPFLPAKLIDATNVADPCNP